MSKKQADKEFIVEARVFVFARSEAQAKKAVVSQIGGRFADFVIDQITENPEVKP